MKGEKFKIKTKVWLYKGSAPWHFITIEKKLAREIDKKFGMRKRGWGSLPVLARIGRTEWRTSIFPDRKTETYLLAIKSEVRKKENISEGNIIKLEFTISP